jgi:hypothetical protein
MNSLQFSGPFSTTHSSRGRRVSGQAQQMRRGSPVLGSNGDEEEEEDEGTLQEEEEELMNRRVKMKNELN